MILGGGDKSNMKKRREKKKESTTFNPLTNINFQILLIHY